MCSGMNTLGNSTAFGSGKMGMRRGSIGPTQVHTSGFSLLGSCSCSVRTSAFWSSEVRVRGSGFGVRGPSNQAHRTPNPNIALRTPNSEPNMNTNGEPSTWKREQTLMDRLRLPVHIVHQHVL